MATVINWQRVLDVNNIEYIERGPNVKRGNLNIRCPFCGPSDPSHHMGISTITGAWACWRNAEHRGKSPVRILMQLLRIPYAVAREMAGLDDDYVDPDGFSEAVARLSAGKELVVVDTRELEIPDDFVTLKPSGATKRHWNYLVEERGFNSNDLGDLCDYYNILAARSGKFKDRVMFMYMVNGKVVSWSGRAIAESSIRYRDLDLDTSLLGPKETLYNYDAMVAGGNNLIVVEGPMDTIKLDYYGKDWGTRAVGISTNSMTEEQIYLLDEMSVNFETTYFMMDNKTTFGIVDSLKLKQKLSQIKNPKIISVPFDRGDAGAMTPNEVISFCRRL